MASRDVFFAYVRLETCCVRIDLNIRVGMCLIAKEISLKKRNLTIQ